MGPAGIGIVMFGLFHKLAAIRFQLSFHLANEPLVCFDAVARQFLAEFVDCQSHFEHRRERDLGVKMLVNRRVELMV